jgi:hypothetical protein
MAYLNIWGAPFLILMIMKTFLLVFAFSTGLASVSFSQTVLPGRDRPGTKIWITNGFKSGQYGLTETDSTMTLTTHDKFRPLIVRCSFDKPGKKGICKSEKVSLDCDSCYKKTFKLFLDKKRFDWKLTGTDRYLSKPSRKLLLAGNAAVHAFTLSILNMGDEEYKKLLSK